MSWIDLESLKTFARMIEVDKHYSFSSLCAVPRVPPNVAW
jgi:hypothetical protein